MYNIKLAGVLRFVSIIVISLLVFLYITINIVIDDIVFKSDDTHPGKEYEYRASPSEMSIPEFTYNLESLFPGQLIPVIAETIIVSEPAAPVDIPLLQFIGMIETDKKIIYSFRNKYTNKLLLFEEGVFLEGITLISVEEKKYTFKKNEITFQVDK